MDSCIESWKITQNHQSIFLCSLITHRLLQWLFIVTGVLISPNYLNGQVVIAVLVFSTLELKFLPSSSVPSHFHCCLKNSELFLMSAPFTTCKIDLYFQFIPYKAIASNTSLLLESYWHLFLVYAFSMKTSSSVSLALKHSSSKCKQVNSLHFW
jgi:hypothetical protein